MIHSPYGSIRPGASSAWAQSLAARRPRPAAPPPQRSQAEIAQAAVITGARAAKLMYEREHGVQLSAAQIVAAYETAAGLAPQKKRATTFYDAAGNVVTDKAALMICEAAEEIGR
jgi:hypothetical protein